MLDRQALRFGLVGLAATGLQFAILTAYVWAGGHPVQGSALGYILSSVANYLLNYKFTFASTQDHSVGVFRFITVAGLGLLLNSAVMAAATIWLAIHFLPSQIIATTVTTAWNFILSRHWTYRSN